jgi:phosphonate transport system substrate-binding protein
MTAMLRRLLLVLVFGLSQPVRAEPVLSVGVVPQFPLEQIASTWTPVLNQVAKAAGVRLELKRYATIPDFEEAFLRGEPDVVFLNPYHAVMARKAAGYLPIIRDDRQRLAGLLVVRRDSKASSPAELDGATIAFPSPNAFGASLYMRALLAEQVRIRFTPVYRSTHSNVFRHVINGQAQAGGVIRQTLEREPPEVREQLRILYETPPAFPHPVVVHPRVPAKLREALQQAFIALGSRADAAPLLDGIQIPVPVKATYADYAPLEKLGLERYVVLKED